MVDHHPHKRAWSCSMCSPAQKEVEGGGVLSLLPASYPNRKRQQCQRSCRQEKIQKFLPWGDQLGAAVGSRLGVCVKQTLRTVRDNSTSVCRAESLRHLVWNPISVKDGGITERRDDLRGTFLCLCFWEDESWTRSVAFNSFRLGHFTATKTHRKYKVNSLVFFFKPAIWEQTTRLLCVTARCNKNRSFGECQAEGHQSRDATAVSDFGTISDFSIISSLFLFFFPGVVMEAQRAWMTYWELHLATEWKRMHNLHSAAGLRTCHWRRFDNWMKITVYECTQGRTIVIYLQLERTSFFNQHVLKHMEKMLWPSVHQDLHRSLNLTHFIHLLFSFVEKTNG